MLFVRLKAADGWPHRLFLVVVVLETTDLVLAADSIPAAFGVTRDPFLVYSSNVCARSSRASRLLFRTLAGVAALFSLSR